MDCIYKNISLDVYDDITSQLTLSVKQGDTARGIRVSLTDHGKVFKIHDNCYAVFSGKKSNGVFISDGCIIQNNTIIYNFTDAVVSVTTQIDCELIVYSANGEKITSPSFMVFVYKTIEEEYAGDVVESNSFTVLNDLISNATETIAVANDAIDRTNTAIDEAVEKTDNTIAEAIKKTDNAIAEAVEKTNAATEEARASVNYIRKTSDGKLEILDADYNVIDTVDVCYMDNDTIYRYSNGVLSVKGIKELNSDETFRMWVGTNAEYMALSVKDENTLYMLTDDPTFDDAMNTLNSLSDDLQSGEFVVNHAENADVFNIMLVNDAFIAENGKDINDYQWNQRYVCNSATIAATLLNLPDNIKSPFVLDVKNTSNFVQQELTICETTDRIPRKFVRNYFYKSSETVSQWGKWVEFDQRTKPCTITISGTSSLSGMLFYYYSGGVFTETRINPDASTQVLYIDIGSPIIYYALRMGSNPGSTTVQVTKNTSVISTSDMSMEAVCTEAGWSFSDYSYVYMMIMMREGTLSLNETGAG